MSEVAVEPVVLPENAELTAEVAAIARRMRGASGPFMKLLNRFGAQLEDRMALLPDGLKDGIDKIAERLLEQSYSAAATLGASKVMPKTDGRLHKLAAMASGAAGGAGGIASAVIELPATVTLIFGALQKIAADHGYDPTSEDVRLLCIDILGSGGPGRMDEGVNTGFIGARIGLSGTSVHALIAKVAPRFGAVLSQKLASQAVPLLGAAAGAGVNLAFMRYYQDMAHVRFGLKRLADTHGEEAVLTAYRIEMAKRLS